MLGAGYAWFDNERKEALAAGVVSAIRYDPSGNCKPEWPLFIGFVNHTEQTVASINFWVSVRRRGYSDSIGEISNKTYDKILARGESYGWCHPLPVLSMKADPTDLDFEISTKYVTFR
jgi:hypothetical protein